MVKTTSARLEALEAATGRADPVFVVVFQKPGGGWVLADGPEISEESITRLAAQPGVVVIRVVDDDAIGLEVDHGQDD